MNEQLTLENIYNVCKQLKLKGYDLSKLRIFLGNDDELNGVHNAWFCELVENNGAEEDDIVVDLINQDYGNYHIDKNEKFILIS